MHQAKLSLEKNEYKSIIALLAKKFAFDRMCLRRATSGEEELMIEGRLYEAGLLFAELQNHPHYITHSTAKWVVGHIRQTENACKSAIELLNSLGESDTKDLDEELRRARVLHEKLNEFLIDCIED